MNRVTIELYLGLSEDLAGDFEAVSEIRSIRKEEIEEGTTFRQLLKRLARRNSFFGQKIFDLEAESLLPYLVINYNGRVESPYEVYDRYLEDGDEIMILPMYAGG